MKNVDIIGLTLQEGMEILKSSFECDIKIQKTIGLNKNFNKELNEQRIIKVIIENKTVTLVVGYF